MNDKPFSPLHAFRILGIPVTVWVFAEVSEGNVNLPTGYPHPPLLTDSTQTCEQYTVDTEKAFWNCFAIYSH